MVWGFGFHELWNYAFVEDLMGLTRRYRGH